MYLWDFISYENERYYYINIVHENTQLKKPLMLPPSARKMDVVLIQLSFFTVVF